ncbi:MAG TPA: PEP/pyruvate-binding domain-containing protein [Patescibacteria group bacterium]
MDIIAKFDELSKNDANIAGGKGASLGEMTQAGLPVPPGFVVLAGAFDRFLEETDLNVEIEAIFKSINQHDIASVEHASEKIQALILNAQMPEDIKSEIEILFEKLDAELVAVRSSATAEDSSAASWAGELESYLNTTDKTLLENVKKCWASLFTPRAIFYRFEKDMHKEHVAVAVVVQKMVQSEVSGIAFTVHPVTEDHNQMVIEAGYGLGEAIVGGMITPDTYVINKSKVESKKSESIEDKNISQQEMMIVRSANGNEEKAVESEKQELQKISDEQIIELSKICISIENHYGFPCDIEWAYEDDKFYVVQSRPITTLNISIQSESKKILTNIFSREKSLIYFCVWDESDRKGVEFIGEKIKNNLFIIPPKGSKGSVWYEKEELEFLKGKNIEKFSDDHLLNDLKTLAEKSWNFLFPYAKQEKAIESPKEFDKYYSNLVNFWTRLNSIVYEVVENESLNNEIRDYLRDFREKTEQYTEIMSLVLTDYLEKQPALKDIAHSITKDEAIKILNGTASELEISSIRSRKVGCYMLNGVVGNLVNLKSVLDENNLELERVNSDVNQLVGTSAFAGKVNGSVKIINGFDDLSKVGLGDVLVTQMTNPKYLPAVQKASAIVTDEGGLLCHAAIVARELKKPCIIGTKFATQVLKDGDLVEVDADNGIVRILEK